MMDSDSHHTGYQCWTGKMGSGKCPVGKLGSWEVVGNCGKMGQIELFRSYKSPGASSLAGNGYIRCNINSTAFYMLVYKQFNHWIVNGISTEVDTKLFVSLTLSWLQRPLWWLQRPWKLSLQVLKTTLVILKFISVVTRIKIFVI